MAVIVDGPIRITPEQITELERTLNESLTKQVVDAMIPPDYVLLRRDHAERLRETAEAAFEARYVTCFSNVCEEGARLRKAVFRHQNGDFDPLP